MQLFAKKLVGHYIRKNKYSDQSEIFVYQLINTCLQSSFSLKAGTQNLTWLTAFANNQYEALHILLECHVEASHGHVSESCEMLLTLDCCLDHCHFHPVS